MGYLGREAILSAEDSVTEDVEVPEWGGTVRVRGLTGAERDKIEALVAGNGKKMNFANLRARMCAASVVDESGERLFGEADIAALGGKSAAALDRVFSVVQRLSGITDEDIDELTGE
ncbi:MAG: hypothetical protein ACRDS1_01415 [Pseudonocardiaceae bacterium]